MNCNTPRSSPIYIHSRSHTGGGSAVNLLDFCHWRESDREARMKWKFKPRAYQRRDCNPDTISLPYPDNQLKEMTFGYSFSNTRYIQECVKQAM